MRSGAEEAKKERKKERVGSNTIKKHDPELFDGIAR
jgi:hypothetical protein